VPDESGEAYRFVRSCARAFVCPLPQAPLTHSQLRLHRVVDSSAVGGEMLVACACVCVVCVRALLALRCAAQIPEVVCVCQSYGAIDVAFSGDGAALTVSDIQVDVTCSWYGRRNCAGCR
jgi:hypothetical protein